MPFCLQESEFLQSVLTRPWTLSTSQTPHTQQVHIPDPNWPTFNDKVCPGGGFGNNTAFKIAFQTTFVPILDLII